MDLCKTTHKRKFSRMDNITFAIEILKKLGVQSHIVDETNFHKVDSGLRGLLFKNDNYTTFLNHTLKEIKDKIIYRYMDEYRCCYITMKLYAENKYFFIGPYLTTFPDNNFIKRKIPANKSSEDAVKLVKKFYMSLPLTDEETPLIAVATAIGKNLWGDNETFTFEYMDDIFFDNVDPSNIPESYTDLTNSSFNLRLLEEKYENENKLLNNVRSGNLNDINFSSNSFCNTNIHKKSPDSLRNRKNNLISLNTLLCKAAEQGGVHPLHIDKLFSRFAEKIEEIHSVQECTNFQKKMIKEYCFIVKEHSLSAYSPLIGKTITIIDYDISADLSLKNISAQLFVNASYLSNSFSRETGMTLTEYVNLRRLNRAIMMLHKTNMQIQDIAANVGFSDANYFIRLFKKQYGITPATYKKTIGK